MKKDLKNIKNKFYANSYTSKVVDWKLFLTIVCETTTQAIKVEKHIKKMKSKVYVINLKKYPEIANKLKEKYLK